MLPVGSLPTAAVGAGGLPKSEPGFPPVSRRQGGFPLHARRTTFGHLVAAVLVLAGLAATGCAKSSTPTASDPGAPTDTAVRSAVSVPAKGQPVDGSQLIYGLEAEGDGFDPTNSRMAISALMMANT